jgi:hypothetical protein
MANKGRKAVVIGINNYMDSEIPDLSGAANDAAEIRSNLSEFGEFEIEDSHFLINEDADSQSIRQAISDLLWKTNSYELALLYFSGHGFQDGYGNGFLAPYDMLKNAPLVHGIDMREIKSLMLNALNKQCVIGILDCCYSGIPTEGEKSVPIFSSLNSYFGDLQNQTLGEGKIIFASSQSDQKSREIEIFKEKESVFHGLFTHHLLEGIIGKAADEAGNIMLDRLINYVQDQLAAGGKQKPEYYAAGASQLDKIRIAISSGKLEEFIRTKLEDADNYIKQKCPLSIFRANSETYKILENSENNKEAKKLKAKIEKLLEEYKKAVIYWFGENEYEIKPKMVSVYQELELLANSLDYERIPKLDKRSTTLLSNLCEVSIGMMKKDVFTDKCRYYDNPKT